MPRSSTPASHPPSRRPHGRAVVVIPTYDERENITTVLDEVLAAASVDVLVVDDSSPDGTADVVRAHPAHGTRVQLLVRTDKEGLGAAYRAGLGWALDAGYERIAQMDADLSHPPARLPDLLAALEHHDVAVGSRYVDGGAIDAWSPSRRLISRVGNAYVRLMLDLPVRDATAGFKAFTADALRTIDVATSQADGYGFQIESSWRADRRGLSLVEVPIVFTDRRAGASKMSTRIVVEALRMVWRWRRADGSEPRAALERRQDVVTR